MTLPTPFPVARYRFDCIVEAPIYLPEYAGSTLRGAFGHALKRTACMTRERDCKTCPLYRSCPYPAIFAPPPPAEHHLQKFSEIPVPFIVEPPAWGGHQYATGEELSFHFVLVGRAHAQLPLVLYAWQRALEMGIGKGDGTAKLIQVSQILGDAETVIYNREEGKIKAHVAELPIFENTGDLQHVALHFDTPLRLQQNGRPMHPEELTARDLLVSLLRRIALISEFHVGQKLDVNFRELSEFTNEIDSEKNLVWQDWTRYSSRQKQEMTLGGAIGEWRLSGVLEPFLQLLQLGQWLHAGKNTSFGLGHYEIIE